MSPKPTVSRRGYPWPIRIANRAVGAADRLGASVASLDRDEILEAAIRQAGSDDWGSDDFLEGMDQILSNADALDLTPMARAITRTTYVKAVTHRLGLQQQLAAHPEIADVKVERPVFVLGFPRSGTTLLQNLLALHPERRGLTFWELMNPLPVHEDPRVDRRRRLRTARATLGFSHLIAPEMNQVHDTRADTLEECWYLFMMSFKVLNWDIMTGFHAYGEWLLDQDMRDAYGHYRQWLQLLLHQRPAGQLLLKCPEHLWFVDALLETFPDACIVWTHRDPLVSVSSYSSLMALTRRLVHGTFDPETLGPYVTERFHEGVDRAMQARDRWGDERSFMDVDFLDLVNDPVGTVRSVCERFDLAWSDDMAQAIRDWQANDRTDKRGAHHYSAEAFHVDEGEVSERFRPYVERFGIPVQRERV